MYFFTQLLTVSGSLTSALHFQEGTLLQHLLAGERFAVQTRPKATPAHHASRTQCPLGSRLGNAIVRSRHDPQARSVLRAVLQAINWSSRIFNWPWC